MRHDSLPFQKFLPDDRYLDARTRGVTRGESPRAGNSLRKKLRDGVGDESRGSVGFLRNDARRRAPLSVIEAVTRASRPAKSAIGPPRHPRRPLS